MVVTVTTTFLQCNLKFFKHGFIILRSVTPYCYVFDHLQAKYCIEINLRTLWGAYSAPTPTFLPPPCLLLLPKDPTPALRSSPEAKPIFNILG